MPPFGPSGREVDQRSRATILDIQRRAILGQDTELPVQNTFALVWIIASLVDRPRLLNLTRHLGEFLSPMIEYVFRSICADSPTDSQKHNTPTAMRCATRKGVVS